jgi:hypothetical protein
MDCASEVVHTAHTVAAHNMDDRLAVVPGQGNREVLHKVSTVVAWVAVQPVLLVAQVVKVWSVVAPLLTEAARLAAPLCLFVLILDYS